VGAKSGRPRDFAVLLANGFGSRIDTRAGRVTKDLVTGRDTTVALRLKSAELDSLYEEYTRSGLFGLPEPYPRLAPEDIGCMITPNTPWYFEITSGGVTKRFSWDSRYCLEHRTAEWKVLLEAKRRLELMIVRTPKYRSLPDERGAYE
jgi:hypothetical protein